MELPPELAAEAEDEDDGWHVVHPEGWDAARLFLAVQTQWARAPNGRATGLDYAACRAAARALGLKWRKVFPGLQAMEAETLAWLRENND